MNSKKEIVKELSIYTILGALKDRVSESKELTAEEKKKVISSADTILKVLGKYKRKRA
ncbi:MAG: hypothetical protein HXS46_14875 [Theionarchaea archaeon]|nr:hypothetical protein [Theionarchaea archaeon]